MLAMTQLEVLASLKPKKASQTKPKPKMMPATADTVTGITDTATVAITKATDRYQGKVKSQPKVISRVIILNRAAEKGDSK
jgi:hypothetical protein